MGDHGVEIGSKIVLLNNILEVLQTVLYIVDVGLRVFVTLPEKSSYFYDQHKLSNNPLNKLIPVLIIVMAQSNQHFVQG